VGGANGRFVAFKSRATNLVLGDTNFVEDVFVHDRETGETTRVSVATGGEQANGPSQDDEPGISADGRFVAFISEATNLVPGDTNGVKDIFVHDRQTGETTRVSVATGGGQANGPSEGQPALNGSGRFVVFSSEASNLVPGDTNGEDDVFVHDRQTGETTRVSVATGGGQGMGGGAGGSPQLSGDGHIVAFGSEATNLVPGDTNGVQDIFIHDRGLAGMSNPNSPDLNGDGRADLVWRNATNGGTMVWQMTAGGLRGPIKFPGGGCLSDLGIPAVNDPVSVGKQVEIF